VSDDVPQNQDESGNCAAPACTTPGGAFTLERDGEIYEFCSERVQGARSTASYGMMPRPPSHLAVSAVA
jgi:hypothetical protein